jgi:hypothetical protein
MSVMSDDVFTTSLKVQRSKENIMMKHYMTVISLGSGQKGYPLWMSDGEISWKRSLRALFSANTLQM